MFWTLWVAAALGQDKPTWGGFGYATHGFALGDVAGLGDALGTGDGSGAPGAGLLFGGGGRAVLAGRMILGGRGYGLYALPSENVNSSVYASGGGGALDLGVLIWNQDSTMIYPTLGLAMGGMDVVVANHSDTTRTLGKGTVAPGGRAQSTGGGATVELGGGVSYLLFDERTQGGAMINLEMGFWIPAGEGSADLIGPSSGMVFRIGAGGGGFVY